MTGVASNLEFGFAYQMIVLIAMSLENALYFVMLPFVALLVIGLAFYYTLIRKKADESLALSASVGEIKKALDGLGTQLNQQQQSIQQVAERMIEHAGEPRGIAEVQEAIQQGNKQVLESVYSQVNHATGASLGEVLASIKIQIKDVKNDLSRQIQNLTALVESARGQPKQFQPNQRVDDGGSHSGLATLVPGKTVSPVPQLPTQAFVENEKENNPVPPASDAIAHDFSGALQEDGMKVE